MRIEKQLLSEVVRMQSSYPLPLLCRNFLRRSPEKSTAKPQKVFLSLQFYKLRLSFYKLNLSLAKSSLSLYKLSLSLEI